jgi:hypothetical protein
MTYEGEGTPIDALALRVMPEDRMIAMISAKLQR